MRPESPSVNVNAKMENSFVPAMWLVSLPALVAHVSTLSDWEYAG